MRHYLNKLYFGLLPIALIPCSTFGIINGIRFGMEKKDPLETFCHTIGYSSLGFITGITYPISLPFLTGYVLLKKTPTNK